MAPETKSQVFEPFFTTKEPGKGTGLGLPVVKGIVQQSGGSIEVYSELNHGTTVKIYLPRVDGEAEEAPSAAKPSGHTGGSERILVVEDDLPLRALIVDFLSAYGYSVQVLEKTDDLEALLRRTPCDLLITDVVMPKMSGPQLALRVAEHWPKIRVLYMSGYTTNAIVHHGVLDQGLFFLQKPFTPAALAAKVREVLDAPRLRPNNPEG